MPYFRSFSNNVLWSTVLKAFLRSRNILKFIFPSSEFLSMGLCHSVDMFLCCAVFEMSIGSNTACCTLLDTPVIGRVQSF